MNRFADSSQRFNPNPNYIFLTHHATTDFFTQAKPTPKLLGLDDLTDRQRVGLRRALSKGFYNGDNTIKKIHNTLLKESKIFLSNMVKDVKHVENHVEIKMFSGRNIIKFAFTFEELQSICTK